MKIAVFYYLIAALILAFIFALFSPLYRALELTKRLNRNSVFRQKTTFLVLVLIGFILTTKTLFLTTQFIFGKALADSLFVVFGVTGLLIGVLLDEKINDWHEQFPYLTEDGSTQRLFYDRVFTLLTLTIGFPVITPLFYFILKQHTEKGDFFYKLSGFIECLLMLITIHFICLLINHWHKKHPYPK